MPRPHPFTLVFEGIAEDSFPRIRAALEQAGHDPRDRDAFLMARDAVALLRDLRPEPGLGGGIDQLVALVHHAFLFWLAGAPTVRLGAGETARLLAADPAPESMPHGEAAGPPGAYYAQLAERRVWAEVVAGDPHEPLDGCFVHETPGAGELRVLGVFGVRPDRAGLSVAEAAGPRPQGLRRPDGSALFAPTLPGAAAAGLASIAGGEELLELGWRTRALAAPTAAAMPAEVR